MVKKDDAAALEREVQSLKSKLVEAERTRKTLAAKLSALRDEMAESEKGGVEEVESLRKTIARLNKEASDILKSKNAEIERIRSQPGPEFILTSDEDVSLPGGSELGGGIKTAGSITLGPGSRVRGKLDAGGAIQLGGDCTADGDLTAGGDIALGDGCSVRSVQSGGTAKVGKNSRTGTIECAGALTVEDGARVEGNISYGHGVSIGKGVTITGSLTARQWEARTEAAGESPLVDRLAAEAEMVAKAAEIVDKRPDDASPKKKHICHICGTVNAAESKWCITCGETFSERAEKGGPQSPKKTGDLRFKLPESKGR